MSKREPVAIKYVLVCDDLREEKDTKKFTVLGLYSRKIFLNAVPVMLPKLAFRICIGPVRVDDIMTMNLIRPDGELIGGGQIKIESAGDHQGEAFVNIVLSPFPIDKTGTYKLVLKHGKKESTAVAFEAEQKQHPK